jgi:hypothetical protein
VQHRGVDPNDTLIGGGIHAYEATIDDAEGSGYLTAEDALAEKRRGALALCEGEYAVIARHDRWQRLRNFYGHQAI